MTADLALIRRAANKARQVAETATPGPWATNVRHHLMSVTTADAGPDSGGLTVATTGMPLHPGASDDAEHIAKWDPATALAVANLLDRELARPHPHAWDADRLADLTAVARAFLKEDA